MRLADLCCEPDRARMAYDGSYYRATGWFKSARLLIINDFLTTPTETVNSVGLFEILEAREGRKSTLVALQLKQNEWCLRI